MAIKHSTARHFESGSLMEALHDIYVGMIVGASHYMFFLQQYVCYYILDPLQRLATTIDDDDHKTNTTTPQSEQAETLRVVGIGFGRTGTYSLTLALEELGIPTLHTQHLYENEAIFRMWSEDIFEPSVEKCHAELGRPNFDVIVENGYQGTADFPMALYFDQIMEEYPDCKFILTTRESSEVWFRSWDTLTKSITAPTHFGGYFISGVKQYSVYLRWLFAIVNQDDAFLTSTSPIMSQQYKEHAIQSYEEHNERVRRNVQPHNLLEYNVQQGWQPLCDFLEIAPEDCPIDTPFPKTNSARSVQVQAVSAAVTPLIIVVLGLFYVVTNIWKRVLTRGSTGKS